MPPVRSMPVVKAVKTERTHEENQERAYIAASRRSDRSLEARVESARRASEIHKRRTGRALRVTEQDVVNEEMYEEEDDSLSLQYRRLTAHLNTPSAEFNRRLASYLTNHVAMRSALDQAISSSLAQDQSTPWPQNAQNIPTPTLDSQNPQYPNSASPTDAQSPGGSLPPFITPADPNYRSTLLSQILQNSIRSGANAANALASPNSATSQSTLTNDPPRSSSNSPRPGLTSRTSSSSVPVRSESQQLLSPSPELQRPDATIWSNRPNASPLSTALPPETQMFFGAGIGGMDSYGNPYDQSKRSRSDNSRGYINPYVVGMSQTLAPAAHGDDKLNWPSYSVSDNAFPPSALTYDDDAMSPSDPLDRPSHADSREQPTPQDTDWESFFDISSWEENDT